MSVKFLQRVENNNWENFYELKSADQKKISLRGKIRWKKFNEYGITNATQFNCDQVSI